MAEHQATVLNTEAGRMFSTKNDEGATRVNYVGLLELQDQMPNDGMGHRLGLWNDGDLLPERMLARVPITAPPTKDERFQMVVRSFFDGAVQPIIAAMAREPMFTHYFADSYDLTRGVRYFYNHEPQAFKFLRKRTDETPNPPQYKRLSLDGESDVEQIKLGIRHGVDETGVEQTRIIVDHNTEETIVKSDQNGFRYAGKHHSKNVRELPPPPPEEIITDQHFIELKGSAKVQYPDYLIVKSQSPQNHFGTHGRRSTFFVMAHKSFLWKIHKK